mgnify:CR=1 FL=1
MNQLAERNERMPMDTVGIANGSTGAKIAPQNLAEVVKFAEVMCRADIALPKHLRGKHGCVAASTRLADEPVCSGFKVISGQWCNRL